MSESKVVGTWWTSSLVPNMKIGFVMVEGVDGLRKIYCGTYNGEDLNKDIEKVIKMWGAPLRGHTLFDMKDRLLETGKYK